MMAKTDKKRDEVLRRLLKTPPKPHKQKGEYKADDPMPTDDPEALIKWGKRNIQKD